jgi:hypothetical protein
MNLDQIEALIAKHGTVTAEPLRDLIVTVVLEAVEEEREACAKLCDDVNQKAYDEPDDWAPWEAADACAAAIRARFA